MLLNTISSRLNKMCFFPQHTTTQSLIVWNNFTTLTHLVVLCNISALLFSLVLYESIPVSCVYLNKAAVILRGHEHYACTNECLNLHYISQYIICLFLSLSLTHPRIHSTQTRVYRNQRNLFLCFHRIPWTYYVTKYENVLLFPFISLFRIWWQLQYTQ